MKNTTATILALVFAVTAVAAQTSASYQLEEHVFNSGGAPDGTSVASASYSLSLVSIGEIATAGSDPASVSYRTSGGFPTAYPAPGEVTGLVFEDATTLSWSPEHSAGSYNLYRDLLSSLSGLGYGDCDQQGLATGTATDPDTPTSGDGFFYLVTVENRLHEEGTKGADSAGSERTGGACP